VYFTGAAFVAACAADHAAGVHARARGVRGDEGGPPELFPDELPERGLERLLATARKKLPGHTLGLLLEGVKRECATRERREFRVDPRSFDRFNRGNGDGNAPSSPFSRAVVEDAVARLHASDRGVRVTCVPDLGAATRHAVGVAAALAKRPFEREVSALDVLAHAKRRGVTPAAALALEAEAAGGSREVSAGAARTDGAAIGVERRGSRLKTCAETWCAALMTIDGCAESSALAICRVYPTMASLMREYARTDLTERAKKELLQNLTRAVTSETQSRDRRVGPVVSARVHSILRPRGAEDTGDEIVGVGA
jgi:hypothetical protein